MSRNLKIQPNFSQHPIIKSSRDVKSLVIYFGSSTRMFEGIGEAFPNLESLWIHDTSLKFIERRNLANLPNLNKLELLDKNIEFLAEESFYDLPNLGSLNLFKCELENLPEKLLWHLKKLTFFGAGVNRIKHLNIDFFKENLQIAEIDFRNNQLQVIQIDFTIYLKIVDLILDNNDCIDMRFSIKRPQLSSGSIQEVQKHINVNCKEKSRVGYW